MISPETPSTERNGERGARDGERGARLLELHDRADRLAEDIRIRSKLLRLTPLFSTLMAAPILVVLFVNDAPVYLAYPSAFALVLGALLYAIRAERRRLRERRETLLEQIRALETAALPGGPPRRAGYLLIASLLVATGCGGPIGIIPGGELSGEEASASAWSEVVSESGTLDLETRPDDPYSVRIGFVYRDGDVYIDPAESRAWYAYLTADPSVRVRIDGRVYRVRAVPVTDPEELRGFDPERSVHRLELATSDPD